MKFVFISLTVHSILLISIFDIYFKSPVIQGIPSIKNDCTPRARRLVLFVADGLRADKFFEVPKSGSRAPFLRDIITGKGVWGVSRTHVPTESRPGHVAIIAGLYEDPSAVFKGWKDNPVEFDSVFNRSRKTYAWGSPDIVPMFSKGSASDRVKTFTYAQEDQDFSAANNNASELNLWVLHKFTQFLKEAEFNDELKTDLKMDKLIYFFHLLGTDVAGHSSKPHSKEYEDNIIIADQIVREIVNMMEKFYEDNATSFVFTSDHGMTDWGSHGAGSVSETETPLVLWGAGAARPEKLVSYSDTPSSWKLDEIRRRDINQADIAPLMSILIGICIPINSVGVLPVEYLNYNHFDAVKALYLNARQIGTQYNWHQENIKKNALSWMNIDYHAMKDEDHYIMIRELEEKLNLNKCTTETVLLAKRLIILSLSGIEYYQNFYCLFLQFLVTQAFLGWSCCLICRLLPHSKLSESGKLYSSYYRRVNMVCMSFVLLAFCLLYAQSLPFLYYIYTCLPIFLWWWVLYRIINTSEAIEFLKENVLKTLFFLISYIVGIEALVLSFFYREILSGVMAVLIVWVLMNMKAIKSYVVIQSWLITAICLAVFPFLPTVGSSGNVFYVIACGCLWILGIKLSMKNSSGKKQFQTNIIALKVGAVALSILNVYIISLELGIALVNLASHAVSWILLGFSLLLLNYGPSTIYLRYIQISLSLAVPYLLLSIGHEVFFTLFLTLHLLSWMNLEYTISKEKSFLKFTELTLYSTTGERDYLTIEDFRRSFFYLYYIFLSFFGIGNIASINSFDVNWVKSFITVFSPFTMSFLILLKTIIPFLLVTVAFRFINLITKSRPQHMFTIVLVFCNIMSLNFFFRVSNKGSWLDIGMSISHYVIMQLVTIFLLGLYEIAKVITSSENVNLLPKQS